MRNSSCVEFADFECPACKKFFEEFEEVRAKHPDKVALVFRHWPLSYHRFAYPSARAAECAAEQGRFEQLYQLLYQKQDSLGLISFPVFASRAGVPDAARFGNCLAGPQRVPAIEADIVAAKALNARGTPTVIMNGTMLSRPPSADQMEKLLATLD